MTTLDRPVTRLTRAQLQGRQLVLRLEVGGKLVRLREKGRRRWHTIAIDAIWWAAVRITAAEQAQERKRRRAERRKLALMGRD